LKVVGIPHSYRIRWIDGKGKDITKPMYYTEDKCSVCGKMGDLAYVVGTSGEYACYPKCYEKRKKIITDNPPENELW